MVIIAMVAFSIFESENLKIDLTNHMIMVMITARVFMDQLVQFFR